MMAMTTAGRQRAFRRRQIDRIAILEHENAQLRAETCNLCAALAAALAEQTRLRVELADVRSQLADALAETERLAGACRHPPPQSTLATATPATATSGEGPACCYAT